MAFSRKRLRILQGILGIVVVGLVIGGGWYLWYHYGWRTYTNDCLHASFSAPVRVPVQSGLPAAGACSVPATADDPIGPRNWYLSAVQIGYVPIESLPQGVEVSISPLLPVTDASAMDAAGLQTGRTVADVLAAFVKDTSNGQTRLMTIHGRQAAMGIVRSPDNPPSDYFRGDIPYCPCTTETALIDAGSNRLFRATAVWLNDDATTARFSSDIINSVTFH